MVAVGPPKAHEQGPTHRKPKRAGSVTCTPGARPSGGNHRRQNVSKGGSVWTNEEVTLSSEWKTNELRHVGTAIANGPVVSRKFAWKSVLEVG